MATATWPDRLTEVREGLPPRSGRVMKRPTSITVLVSIFEIVPCELFDAHRYEYSGSSLPPPLQPKWPESGTMPRSNLGPPGPSSSLGSSLLVSSSAVSPSAVVGSPSSSSLVPWVVPCSLPSSSSSSFDSAVVVGPSPTSSSPLGGGSPQPVARTKPRPIIPLIAVLRIYESSREPR
ncbi:MAG: hypothetical protein HC927_03095 [Deltaproteobacteria bacterium]|nr:hypothetical protein [Deltaproteobacteria bacterium]